MPSEEIFFPFERITILRDFSTFRCRRIFITVIFLSLSRSTVSFIAAGRPKCQRRCQRGGCLLFIPGEGLSFWRGSSLAGVG